MISNPSSTHLPPPVSPEAIPLPPSRPGTPTPPPSIKETKGEESPTSPETPPIYHTKGPSASLVKRLIAQQEAQRKTSAEGSPPAASASGTSTAKADPELEGEFREAGMTPEVFLSGLGEQARKLCPGATDAVIEAALEGALEGLKKLMTQEDKAKGSKRRQASPAPHAAAETPAPPPEIETAGNAEENALVPHRAGPISAAVGTVAVQTPQQQIAQHLTNQYHQLVPDLESGAMTAEIRRQIDELAGEFVRAGCNSPQDADKMVSKMVNRHRGWLTGLSGVEEAGGFSMMMLTFVYQMTKAVPRLNTLKPAGFGAAAGGFVGLGMAVFSEAMKPVKDNHTIKLKPTGVDAIDRLLPSTLRIIITAILAGAIAGLLKNLSLRAGIPWLEGQATHNGLDRTMVSTQDTLMDTIGSPIAAAIAAFLVDLILYPNMKRLLPFQEGMRDLIRKINEPTTCASALKTIQKDITGFVTGAANGFVSASSWAAAGVVAALVAGMLHVKAGVTKGHLQHSDLPPSRMTGEEAAQLGAVSSGMMFVLAIVVPLVALGVKETADKHAREWFEGMFRSSGNSASVQELDDDAVEMDRRRG